MYVDAVEKEPAVAQTELKTIYNSLPGWDLSETDQFVSELVSMQFVRRPCRNTLSKAYIFA